MDPHFPENENGVKLKKQGIELQCILYVCLQPQLTGQAFTHLTGLPLTASPKYITLHAVFSCLI